MTDSSDCISQLISQINIENPIWYIICVIFSAIIIRAILCIFKAFAITNGELDNPEMEIKWKVEKYWPMFFSSFWSNKNHVTIDDYWLPAIVGFAELLVYPFLMSLGKWLFIGAWIGVKTASSWGGWHHYRTAYNRFLLGNMLSLIFSIILAMLFMK